MSDRFYQQTFTSKIVEIDLSRVLLRLRVVKRR